MINTGWIGASAQSGAKRISLQVTRKIIYAVLDGTIKSANFETDPYFGVDVPTSLDDLGPETLLSSKAWSDLEEYKSVAEQLVKKFQENFKEFNIDDDKILKAGPKLS